MSDQLITSAEVARVLGVSRQSVATLLASHVDFPRPDTGEGRHAWERGAIERWAVSHPDRGLRYERSLPLPGKLVDPLRHVLALATAEASALNHWWVGLDHLFLAVASRDASGAARIALESFGIGHETLKSALVKSFGDPFEPKPGGLSIPVITQLALERATLLRLELQDTAFGSEHVLLSLLQFTNRCQTGVFLERTGVTPERLRDQVLRVTAEPTQSVDAVTPPSSTAGPHDTELVVDHAQTDSSGSLAFEFAPTPSGHDPRERKPWSSELFRDGNGRPLDMEPQAGWRQYYVDRDGNPVLSTTGKAVHILLDARNALVTNEMGEPVLVAIEVPPGRDIDTRP